jgi:hypothetical protein
MSAFIAKSPANDARGTSPEQSLDAVRDILFGVQTRGIEARIDAAARAQDARVTEIDAEYRRLLKAEADRGDAALKSQHQHFTELVNSLDAALQAQVTRHTEALAEAERRSADALAALRQSLDATVAQSAARGRAARDALIAAARALQHIAD